MIGAEDQVTQDGVAFLGHHTLIGQGHTATRAGKVHQDLWQKRVLSEAVLLLSAPTHVQAGGPSFSPSSP